MRTKKEEQLKSCFDGFKLLNDAHNPKEQILVTAIGYNRLLTFPATKAIKAVDLLNFIANKTALEMDRLSEGDFFVYSFKVPDSLHGI